MISLFNKINSLIMGWMLECGLVMGDHTSISHHVWNLASILTVSQYSQYSQQRSVIGLKPDECWPALTQLKADTTLTAAFEPTISQPHHQANLINNFISMWLVVLMRCGNELGFISVKSTKMVSDDVSVYSCSLVTAFGGFASESLKHVSEPSLSPTYKQMLGA